jgi:hypothetical protein
LVESYRAAGTGTSSVLPVVTVGLLFKDAGGGAGVVLADFTGAPVATEKARRLMAAAQAGEAGFKS